MSAPSGAEADARRIIRMIFSAATSVAGTVVTVLLVGGQWQIDSFTTRYAVTAIVVIFTVGSVLSCAISWLARRHAT